MLGRFVLSIFICAMLASPIFGQTSIEQMTAGQLVNAHDRIPECRGLDTADQRSRSSKEMSCVQFFLKRGGLALDARDFASAVVLFSEAVRTNTRRDFTEPYWRRAAALEKQLRFDSAMGDYNEAIGREPTDSISLSMRGMLHLMNKDMSRALEDLNRAIALDPGLHDALMARGDAWLRLDDTTKARADFEAVLRLPAKDRSRMLAQETAMKRLAALPVPQKAAAVVAPLAAAPDLNRVALVIGNSDYRNTSRLPNPVKDAEAIARTLKQIGFRDVVQLSNLGREQMLDGLRKFAAVAEKADWAVVYFSGHGMEVAGINYLVPLMRL